MVITKTQLNASMRELTLARFTLVDDVLSLRTMQEVGDVKGFGGGALPDPGAEAQAIAEAVSKLEEAQNVLQALLDRYDRWDEATLGSAGRP